MYHAGCKQISLPANDHFQLAFEDIGNLLMNMLVCFEYTVFFNIPNRYRSLIAMYEFAKEARPQLTYGYIVEVFH